MRRLRGTWTAAAAVSLFLLTACANTATADGIPAGSASGSAAAVPGEAPVLRVRQIGGFVTPQTNITRFPIVSVYDDGLVITEGPQIAIYPGPALPGLQAQQISPAAVKDLVAKAVAAGVKTGADFGQPGVADVPSTRFTVLTAGGEQSVDVMALGEARTQDPGLTAAQQAARAKLAAFLEQLTSLPDGTSPARPYVPATVVAVAQPFTAEPDPSLSTPPALPWPGPALPGDSLGEGLGLGCVTVTGDQVTAVLQAAAPASVSTPWASAGKQWSVTFRPLLPDETDCEGLKAASS